jgi:hypothetical protein
MQSGGGRIIAVCAECSMLQRLTTLALFCLGLAAGAAHAASATCEAQADAKKLSGAARTSFVKKCQTDLAAASPCEAQADDKKLAGAARTSFVTKCERDAAGSKAAAACEAQATEKKLAGAARTSFTKKCVEDAGG